MKRRRRLEGAATACSTTERWVRGGVGWALGSMVGGMIGAGVGSVGIVEHQGQPKTWPIYVAAGMTILGGLGGALFGVRKPQC